MSSGTKDQVEGKFHEVKGKVKEKAGQVINNPDLEAEGKPRTSLAKFKRKSGRLKKSLKRSKQTRNLSERCFLIREAGCRPRRLS